ncbi:Abi family protein [Turicibacter bilis]|uniref:Abi family protein n=1 Tax=Turicibacter bilis TaxID=2735723 RepID=A0A9Q9CQ76_9FIRM|nr:Abi family protein [Turicibacter bilis]MBS3197970.1 Abi family protein [Turicibacter bilis]UUF07957.1 Abi family protein [Turicibacter bilis]
MATKVKSIDGLMRHLRDTHNIDIKGSIQKQKLRNIGYYHGYKGYRYFKTPNNQFLYTDFNQVLAVNEFDMELKALFYPKIMFIETAIKNYTLEVILDCIGTDSFNDVYSKLLTHYNSFPIASKDYKFELKQRLELQNKIYSSLSRNYNTKLVIQHYYHQDRNVPIWAIFEVITLGEFGKFIHCLNQNTRKLISTSIGLNQGYDTDSKLTESIIYLLRDLRNAVAHNDIIFDTRFKTGQVKKTLVHALSNDCKVQDINFNTITDYVILISFILKQLGVSKTEISKMISDFDNLKEEFRQKIPYNIYSKIIHTDTNNKLLELRNYIKS